MNKTAEKISAFVESKYLAIAIAFVFLIAGLILCCVTNGTCDEGDSVRHYQFAKGAIKHHQFFFHHWAKPFFVLVACPFAQFGFVGIKLFNLLLSFGTALFTYGIAARLNIRRKGLVVLLYVMSPALIVHSLSGLTEPLFAFVLSASVLLYLKDKYFASCLLLSFLPMVRSEGLIILGVFIALLLFEKRFKWLPLLAFGQVAYSIAGSYIHKNLFWVFTKIPYAHLNSAYGKGTWQHFFIKMPAITGWVLYTLIVLGILVFVAECRTYKRIKTNRRELFLVYGCALSYFFAHVTFWALGIFNSFGLMRVIIGILPLLAIIGLRGLYIFNFITYTYLRIAFVTAALAAVIADPFVDKLYGWHKRDFMLNNSQELFKQTAEYIKLKYPNYKKHIVYYDAPYMAEVLDIDYDDQSESRATWQRWEKEPQKEILLWDNWYSLEIKTTFEQLVADERWQYVTELTNRDPYNSERKVAIFISKN